MRERILNNVASIKVFPSIDAFVLKSMEVLGNPSSSFHDLHEILKYDNATTSKIISLANSAFYSRGVQITSLERAMIAIGYEDIKRILACMMFLNKILKDFRIKEGDLLSLWRHSLYVACAAKIICSRTLTEHPEKAFTAALLHDIGKLIFYLVTENYAEVTSESDKQGKDVTVLEKENYGIDHQELGKYLSKKWRFPDTYAKVIGHHHEKDNRDPLVNLVNKCDLFSMSNYASLGELGFLLTKAKHEIEEEVKRIETILEVREDHGFQRA